MALSANTYQYIRQLGLTREISADRADSVVSNWLVPANGWHNSQRLPHAVAEDLANASFEKTVVEGIEYYKVPEESTNLPGLLSHYAQRTGVAELQNPPGGGVNRVPETFANGGHAATVAPDAVQKYVSETDNYEEARKKVSEEEARVQRQVTVSPGREPDQGALVTPEAPVEEAAPKKSAPSKKAE